MAKKNKPEKQKNDKAKAGVTPVAVIDIGSNELRLKIAQSGKGKLKYLESLTYPMSLGRDTFNTTKISFEKVDKTCDIIRGFLAVAAGYGISGVRAVATSAVREAVNRDYILEQIKVKTGLSVEVIDDSQEKLYVYKLMNYLLNDGLKQSAMMVYIGAGNIGLAVLDGGMTPFMQNIKVGSLRINEMFEDMQEYSNSFSQVLEEYIASFTDMLDEFIPAKITNFIASGSEISLIGELCGAHKSGIFLNITKSSFDALYNQVKDKTADRIAEDYNLPIDKAEVLLPAMCIFDNLLRFTHADKIIAPTVFLSDSLIVEMLYPNDFKRIDKKFNENTLLSAAAHARAFHTMAAHGQSVCGFAEKIFDKMKGIHGLGGREKLLLETAALLHDIGKFINVKHHYLHSYHIIQGLDIVGLSILETEIVACVSLYHSRKTPAATDESYRALTGKNRVLVSKLSAILRLAEALDRSHEQKLDEIDVRLTDRELTVTITSDKNTDLEQWAFMENSVFFEEVFGIRPVMKRKKSTP